MMIVMRRLVKVDHKVRTDINYPAGFMDVISVDKTGENYRLLFDTKGRFVLHRVSAEEAKFKLCKVLKIAVGSKATTGKNPFHQGSASAVPYAVTHDGRTIRYPDPLVKRADTVKFDITTGKIVDFIKFEVGNTAVITRGANAGRVGVIITVDKHPGAFDIVKLKDKRGNSFATRSDNVFVIGEGSKPWISLPRGKGIKLSIIEEKEKLERGTASKKKD
jgi:small subunit ribosomal protein S4e